LGGNSIVNIFPPALVVLSCRNIAFYPGSAKGSCSSSCSWKPQQNIFDALKSCVATVIFMRHSLLSPFSAR